MLDKFPILDIFNIKSKYIRNFFGYKYGKGMEEKKMIPLVDFKKHNIKIQNKIIVIIIIIFFIKYFLFILFIRKDDIIYQIDKKQKEGRVFTFEEKYTPCELRALITYSATTPLYV